MTPSFVRVPGFRPTAHGLPFPNRWPADLPVVSVPTPLGRIGLGSAADGVCGGMVLAALDGFLWGVPPPAEPTPAVFRYLVRRLFDSWDLPLGGVRYYAWQCRPSRSRFAGRVRLVEGLSYRTAVGEWPRVRAALDAGLPAPLGLVCVDTRDPRQVGRNHQVLAYGYDPAGPAGVAVRVYDPNHPGRDDLTLHLDLADPDAGRPVGYPAGDRPVRGFFLTEYRRPGQPPSFDGSPGSA